ADPSHPVAGLRHKIRAGSDGRDSIMSHLAGSKCPQDSRDLMLVNSARGAISILRRNTMRNIGRKALLTATVLIPVEIYAQPRPGNPTTATVITKAEIDKISATE